MDSLSILELSHLSVIFSLLRRSVRLLLLNAQARLTWPWPEPSVNILGLEVGSLKMQAWECSHLELSLLTSQPWKLQRRPLVHTPSELYLVMMSSTILFSYWSISCHCSQSEAKIIFEIQLHTDITSGVSIEMRSIHMLRQIFLASSQPTWK